MASSSAHNPAFEEWWKSLSGVRTWAGDKPLVEQAFDAGYAAAVKAHDANPCVRPIDE